MNIGDKAPEILGLNEKGEEIRLSNYKGKKIVLYFYPKDMTSGCTAQACNLRDNYAELRAHGYEVIGVVTFYSYFCRRKCRNSFTHEKNGLGNAPWGFLPHT